jgi:hypothetical protein
MPSPERERRRRRALQIALLLVVGAVTLFLVWQALSVT